MHTRRAKSRQPPWAGCCTALGEWLAARLVETGQLQPAHLRRRQRQRANLRLTEEAHWRGGARDDAPAGEAAERAPLPYFAAPRARASEATTCLFWQRNAARAADRAWPERRELARAAAARSRRRVVGPSRSRGGACISAERNLTRAADASYCADDTDDAPHEPVLRADASDDVLESEEYAD